MSDVAIERLKSDIAMLVDAVDKLRESIGMKEISLHAAHARINKLEKWREEQGVRYKCARCGSLLTVVHEDDGCFAVHPCARCAPHPALAASAEDFAELREQVAAQEQRLLVVEALCNTHMQVTPPLPLVEWSPLYGVRSTPQTELEKAMTPPPQTTTGGTGEEGA